MELSSLVALYITSYTEIMHVGSSIAQKQQGEIKTYFLSAKLNGYDIFRNNVRKSEIS